MAALAGPVGKAVEVSASLLGGAGGPLELFACRPKLISDLAFVRWVAAAASFASTGSERTRGRGEGRSPCSLRCRDDLVAAAVGVSRGCESVVDLRKGPQGSSSGEAGEERVEASALSGARLLSSRSHSSCLPAPHGGHRRLKAPRPSGSWFWFHFEA